MVDRCDGNEEIRVEERPEEKDEYSCSGLSKTMFASVVWYKETGELPTDIGQKERNKFKKGCENYVLSDGQLFKYHKWIPMQHETKKILLTIHLKCGHLSPKKMVKLFTQDFHVPRSLGDVMQDAENVVEHCSVCLNVENPHMIADCDSYLVSMQVSHTGNRRFCFRFDGFSEKELYYHNQRMADKVARILLCRESKSSSPSAHRAIIESEDVGNVYEKKFDGHNVSNSVGLDPFHDEVENAEAYFVDDSLQISEHLMEIVSTCLMDLLDRLTVKPIAQTDYSINTEDYDTQEHTRKWHNDSKQKYMGGGKIKIGDTKQIKKKSAIQDAPVRVTIHQYAFVLTYLLRNTIPQMKNAVDMNMDHVALLASNFTTLDDSPYVLRWKNCPGNPVLLCAEEGENIVASLHETLAHKQYNDVYRVIKQVVCWQGMEKDFDQAATHCCFCQEKEQLSGFELLEPPNFTVDSIEVSVLFGPNNREITIRVKDPIVKQAVADYIDGWEASVKCQRQKVLARIRRRRELFDTSGEKLTNESVDTTDKGKHSTETCS